MPLDAAPQFLRSYLDDPLIQGEPEQHPAPAKPCLFEAARTGDHAAISTRLVTGADIDAASPDGWTPLQVATAHGHHAAVGALLAGGARPDRRSSVSGSILGTTALHIAAACGHLPVLRTLLAAGADPNLRDDAGFAVLHVAAARGDNAMIKALLLAGANPRAEVAYTSCWEIARSHGERGAVGLLRQAHKTV